MQYYQAKVGKVPGTDFREVHKNARNLYEAIRRKTKRKPHIRSKYFRNSKIFLDIFWSHLYSKNIQDRFRRLRFYNAAIELIINSSCKPESKQDPNDGGVILHRFTGRVVSGEWFCVQIKEGIRTGSKHFISVFPTQ